MKKYIYMAVASLFAIAACEKEALEQEEQVQEEVTPVDETPSKGQVTISVSIPDVGLATKVSFEEEDSGDGKMRLTKLSWETGDILDINGKTFTVKDGSITNEGKTALFTGDDPGEGPYTIIYSSLPGDMNNQRQKADGDPDYLGYSVSLTGASSYNSFVFSESGATALGGTFSQSSVLQLRAVLPAAVASSVKKVIFKSSKNDLFGGSNTLKVELETPGTAGTDNTLDIYAALPAGADVTLDSNMDFLIQFQTSDNDYDIYTAYRQFTSGTHFIIPGRTQYIGINCGNIDKYANKSISEIGTVSNPYLIGDQHQMSWLASNIASGNNVKLVDDIDMTGVAVSLNPDGAVTFEGNDKVIRNSTAPLFIDLKGTVQNFTIYNAVITSAETVGILANTCNSVASTVTNVTITGDESPKVSSLTCTADAARKYVGGLVGEVSTLSTFNDCHVINSTISVPSSSDVSYTGGAFGYLHHDTSHTCTVKYCTIESCSIYSFSYTGGLVGSYSRGRLQYNIVGYDEDGNEKKCIVADHAGESSGESMGGLVGWHRYGYIEDNSVYCEVKGGQYTGGLIGYSYQGASRNSTCGEVISSGGNVGGLIGYSRGNITACHSSCSVTAAGNVGGLIGHAYNANLVSCYAIGEVTPTSHYAGGLVGVVDNTTEISKCYSNSKISGNYSSAIGNRGGLVGRVLGTAALTIENSYSTGDIGSSSVKLYRGGGGILGTTEAGSTITVANCWSSCVITGVNNLGALVGTNSSTGLTCSGFIGWSALANLVGYGTSVSTDLNYLGQVGSIYSQATALTSALTEAGKDVWDFAEVWTTDATPTLR